MKSPSQLLNLVYETLYESYGPQFWWPADTPFEVMLGAILTQNTAWGNVEKAMAQLKAVCDLTPAGILSLPEARLSDAIRPSGYFNQKAVRLRTLCRFILRNEGGVEGLRSVPTRTLREQLLELRGVGPETADSILLYALEKPIFVVDAYTIRLCSRVGLTDGDNSYERVQALFMDNLRSDVQMFNEYHALIVRHCKLVCKKKEPLGGECVLAKICMCNLKS